MEGGVEGGLEVGREGDGGVWRWRSEGRSWEFVEVEVAGGGGGVMEARAGVAEVGGGGDDVDGDVVGGDEAGEVEELVEMAVSYEWHHYHHHFSGEIVAGHF